MPAYVMNASPFGLGWLPHTFIHGHICHVYKSATHVPPSNSSFRDPNFHKQGYTSDQKVRRMVVRRGQHQPSWQIWDQSQGECSRHHVMCLRLVAPLNGDSILYAARDGRGEVFVPTWRSVKPGMVKMKLEQELGLPNQSRQTVSRNMTLPTARVRTCSSEASSCDITGTP